jgi:chorismate mutase
VSPDDIPEDEDMSTATAEPAAVATQHIAGLRERLDEIDAKIIELWLERAAISQEVGRTRVASGGTRLVLNREKEILERYRTQLGPDGVQLALLILRAGRGPL